jgi:WD40 repeat protein/tetratricopeptide (TPR) repeat protein
MANTTRDHWPALQSFEELLAAYLQALEAGQSPDRQEWLRRYPQLAEELQAYFQNLDLFEKAAGPPTARFHVAEPESALPRSFGEYELLEKLAEGGMGIVWKARQLRLNRLVALKMIRAGQFASSGELRRFQLEAENAAHLEHPHIVPLYEVGECEGQPYFTMKLIEGGSLVQHLPRLAQDSRALAQLLAAVARAVHYAHQRGILHRDLKPGNILLDAQGQPHVADFGLAKRLEGSAHVTQSGVIVGTAGYMAPEQATGQRQRLTTAADVYGLGAILYELLTGQPPFRADTPLETLLLTMEREPPRPRTLQPRIDADLETICVKCLHKEPERRYRSAEALAEDLERWLKGEPIRARPVGKAERLWRWCRNNRTVATLTASVALLLVLIAVGSSVTAVWLGKERDKALDAERQKTEKLGESYLNEARAWRWSGRAGQRFQGLEALVKAAEICRTLNQGEERLLEIRNEAIGCMALVDLRIDEQWEGEIPPGSRGTMGAGFAPNFERYAVSDDQGNVSVRRVADHQEIVHLPGPGQRAYNLTFSPTGRFLAAEKIFWDLARRETILDVRPSSGSWSFSPDDSAVAVRKQEGNLSLFELPSGKEAKWSAIDGNPTYHPNGHELAISKGATVEIRDVNTGNVKASVDHKPASVYSLAWHLEGTLLATGCTDYKIYVWDIATRPPSRKILEGHQGVPVGVTFSHGGDLLASTGWDGTVRLWDPFAGRQLVSTTSHHSWYVQFSPDDRRLAYKRTARAGKIKFWEVPGGHECRTFSRYKPFDSADISPKGRLMVTAGKDGIRIWDLTAAKECEREIVHLKRGPCASAHFHSDGESLITSESTGLYRWPILPDPRAGRGTIKIGPPQLLGLPQPTYGAFLSPDGRRVAVTVQGGQQFAVFAIEKRDQQLLLENLGRGGNFSLENPGWGNKFSFSPDGRWIATGNRQQSGVRVWEAQSGKLIKELPAYSSAAVGFSPDGRWLVICTDQEYCFWETDSWQPGLRIARQEDDDLPGGFVFTRDGKLLALSHSRSIVRLVDPSTGREFATLPTSGGPLCFSHDGSLIVTAGEDRAIQVWDLRLIREQLATMGLDWDLSPYEPGNDGQAVPPRLQVKVDLGKDDPGTNIGLNSFLLALNPFNFEAYFQRGRAYGRLRATLKAIADYSMALALMPPEHTSRGEALFRRSNNYRQLQELAKAEADLYQFAALDLDLPSELHQTAAQQCNNLAWPYVAGSEKQRDPNKALALAQKAVKLTPGQWIYWNTLGVVYYRLGQYSQAMEKLEHSLRDSKGEAAAFDLFFLAMCHARCGDSAQAKECYDRAVSWVQEHHDKLQPGWKEELDAFRAEAQATLGKSLQP